jgi:hypothetical protein
VDSAHFGFLGSSWLCAGYMQAEDEQKIFLTLFFTPKSVICRLIGVAFGDLLLIDLIEDSALVAK